MDETAKPVQTGAILTRDEVAEKLHITADTASHLISQTGKGINVCRRLYIYEHDLDVYLSSLRGKKA